MLRPFFLPLTTGGLCNHRYSPRPNMAANAQAGVIDEGDDRAGHASEGPGPRPLGGGAAEHDSDPLERPDRGRGGDRRRRCRPQADGDRSRPADQRAGRGQCHRARRDHRARPHLVRHRPQAARGQPGRADRRRGADAGQCRPRAVHPVDAAARRFPGDRRGRPADRLRAAGGDPAPDHRQDPLRHLDRGDALLSERHLPARLRRGAAGAEGGRDRRPPAGAGDGAAARRRAGHARA